MCHSSLLKWWCHLYCQRNNSQRQFQHRKFDANLENLLPKLHNKSLRYCTQNVLEYAGVSIRAGSRLHSRLLRFSGRLLFSKEDFFQTSVAVLADLTLLGERSWISFESACPRFQSLSLPAKLRMPICGLP